MNCFLTFLVFAAAIVSLCEGHGMIMDPVGRASRWRFNSSAPIDYDDNQSYCGSYGTQWGKYGGKCGICGDSYGEKVPRSHELGGFYGEGVIVKSYKVGENLPVKVFLETNHWGYFVFDICNLDGKKETEECFQDLKLADGEDKYVVKTGNNGDFKTTLQLPKGFKCNHCVLRWTYVTASSWGLCPDGTGKNGCGPQEWFRSCADISVDA